MGDSPKDLIDKYLERVRVYLPVGSEETLLEMRTHLIEEAQRLGDGRITHGSAMMAIERFGDPKEAANAYAGTGKKVGPIPAEYFHPLLRIGLILAALSAVFIVASYFVGLAVPGLGFLQNFPFSILAMIAISLVYAFIIIGGLSLLDRGKPPTEKTTLESVLGIGSGVFKPKGRWEALGEAVFGTIFGVILLLPQIMLLFRPTFLVFLYAGALLIFLDAIKGLLFFLAGENNVTLLIQAAIAAMWVILAVFLINVSWPLESFYVFNGDVGTWLLVTVEDIQSTLPPEINVSLGLSLMWIFIIFIIVVTNLWSVLISAMKIPMYLEEGKGWWWQGRWTAKDYETLIDVTDMDQQASS
ncbi:hypothetical protein EU537_03910 [Candidatus Thorarchaeota archaeon]|nr:MAG: hypothetical protein EU537_03910 [Candidatus Thorarchaeota archaeon]